MLFWKSDGLDGNDSNDYEYFQITILVTDSDQWQIVILVN